MKRFIAFVVALSMVLALVVVPVSAEKASTPVTRDVPDMHATFTAEAPETIEAGEEFEVVFSISGNYETHALGVNLAYDYNAFEIVSYEGGPVLAAAAPFGFVETNEASTSIYFGYLSFTGAPLTTEGIIFTATFKAKTDAQPGNYAFTPNIKTPGNFVYMPPGTTVGEYIPYTMEPANVEILDATAVSDPTENMNANIFVESPEKAKAGEDIEVTLNVSGEYQLTGLQIHLYYDANIFQITEFVPGEVLDAATAAGGYHVESHEANPGEVALIVLIPDGDVSDEGVIYTLKMHVADDAEPDVYYFGPELASFFYSEPGTTETYEISNVTVEGSETEIVEVFTVTWQNWDGTELEVDEEVEAGTMPTYDGNEPTKEGDDQYTYIFIGWAPEVSEVTGDITYTAVFEQTVNTYTVTWVNWDGTELEVDTEVPYGTMPTYDGNEPTKEGDDQYTYTFIGWAPEVSEVTGDITYTAVFEQTVNTYTVTFVYGYDFSLTETVEVPYGSAATAPELPEYFWYVFTGWDTDFSNVTENITVTASYFERGDADQDGDVDTADALFVLRYILELEPEADPSAMDVNRDGVVDSMDSLLILRHVMNLLSPDLGW